MNLSNIVSSVVAQINPRQEAILRISDGYTIVGGKQTPKYLPDKTVLVQKQELTQRELMQVDNINKQGVLCSIYIPSNVYGVLRASQLGGDLVIIGAQTWKIVQVLEAWNGWCKVAGALQ